MAKPLSGTPAAIKQQGMVEGRTVKLYELVGADSERPFSPYCWAARLACLHKGLIVWTVPTRFNEKEKLKFSGQKLVPVLVDGDKVVSDSWQIACYLEEAYPEPSLFGGELGTGAIAFVKNWTNSWKGFLSACIVLDIEAHLAPADKAYFRETREKRVGKTLEEFAANSEEKLAAFRKALDPMRSMVTQEGQAFLGGSTPSYADYLVFGNFMWARSISPVKLLEDGDPIRAWRKRMLDLFNGEAQRSPGYDS